MKLLHLFMFLLFVIGILLIITTFSAYGKLKDKCGSDGLRNKLRWAIVLGTTLVTLSLGYIVCINKSNCSCSFGEGWKIYSLLTILAILGGGLLVLTLGIKKDLKKDGCDIELGMIPMVLMILSISQIILPIIYIFYITKLGSPKKEKKEEDEEDDDNSLALEAESRMMAVNSRRKARINKSIATKREKLVYVLDNIEKARDRKKAPKIEDISTKDRLSKEISKANSELKSIQNSSNSGRNSGKNYGKNYGRNSDDDDDDELYKGMFD
jgi:hypothetical protein